MNVKNLKTGFVTLICVSVAAIALAADQQKGYQAKSNSYGQPGESHRSKEMNQEKERVTFAIRGADSAECARMLSSTLREHGIQASVGQSQNKPSMVEVSINPKENLGALGKAISETNTPGKASQPPSLDLVLYGNFDSVNANKAITELGKIKGVDARSSLASEANGQLWVRINGSANVSAHDIHHALQQAGVQTQFTQSKSSRTGLRPFRRERAE